MATQYTGNPAAAQAPSPAPSLSADPIGVLPADGDTLNVSSVAQALKVPLDWIAYLRLWASGVAAAIASAVAAALVKTTLTTQVSTDIGTVAGQYLQVLGSVKEVGFMLGDVPYNNLAVVVTLTGSAYLSGVNNIQVTVTDSLNALPFSPAKAQQIAGDGTHTNISIVFDTIEIGKLWTAYVMIKGE